MNWPSAKAMRRRFFVAFGHAVRVTWPVLSAILGIQLALGLLIGFVEGWSFGDTVYFTFITGLTIGYGGCRPAADVDACTCDRNWLLRALSHGSHSGNCGPRNALSAH